MSRLAPPVHYDLFAYYGALYAYGREHGGGSYVRATPSQITHLLRNDHPNNTLHFWRSQLVHYGLIDAPDIDLAKHRLQMGLDLTGLEVPAGILAVEQDLKSR